MEVIYIRRVSLMYIPSCSRNVLPCMISQGVTQLHARIVGQWGPMIFAYIIGNELAESQTKFCCSYIINGLVEGLGVMALTASVEEYLSLL